MTDALTIDFPKIRSSVGEWYGYGADESVWGTLKTAKILKIIRNGLSEFYIPSPIQDVVTGKLKAHNWSFLRPTRTLQLTSGVGDYFLPEDFGIIMGIITHDSQNGDPRVDLVSESQIRDKRQINYGNGFPTEAAILPADIQPGQLARQKIIFWRIPDADYKMKYRYQVSGAMLSEAAPYPYGTQLHGQTIMASCLAAAEWEKRNTRGEMWQDFQRRMAGSIEMDRKSAGGRNYGQYGDPYAGRDGDCWDRTGVTTVNGVLYDGD